MEKVLKTSEYKGYVIQQVQIETAGGVVTGPSTDRTTQKVTPSYTQWQIVKNKVVDTAMSEDDAKAKVDKLASGGR